MSDWLLQGRLEQIVTSVTLVNNTVKNIDTIVPAGEKWILINISATNIDDVVRNVTAKMYKEPALTNHLRNIMNEDAVAANGSARITWPSSKNNRAKFTDRFAPVIMVTDNTLRMQWAAGGASTGATDADGLIVEYLKYDV